MIHSNIVFFDNAKDLEVLTGLTNERLWEHGFNLDDMDWGFVSDECYVNLEKDDYGYDSHTIKWDIPQWAEQIMFMMDNYCVGFSYVEYNGKHYYTQHHA